jgi:hypothetical protein
MVFLDVVALGVALGLALGGSLARLGELQLRRVWLVFAAMALQVAAFPSGLPWTTPDAAARALWLVSYALLIAAALSNRRIAGIRVMALGLALNLVAILANGGHMPVLPAALRATGRDYGVHNNSISLAAPNLGWLVDRWGAPSWVPLANVFSVGDVVIAAGLLLAPVVATRPRPPLLRRALPHG